MNKHYLNSAAGLTLALTIALAGCEARVDSEGRVTIDDPSQLPGEPIATVVCDPLGGAVGNQQATSGIRGSLHYFSENIRSNSKPVDQYLNEGTNLGITLYMNDLNVPTRPFDRGFETLAGTMVRNQQGEAVYEYFGMDLRATLKLAANEVDGYYQFAMITDDGAILEIDHTGQGLGTLMSAPYIQPPRLTCATETIHLAPNSRVPMRLRYMQGPRYHIALQLMWRRVSEANRNNAAYLANPACGQFGTDLFHDSSTTPSTPTAAYNYLLGEGFHPLVPDNFELPANSPSNPCNNPGNGNGGGAGGIGV